MQKITLITACYNNEKTIADTMQSVAKQRYGNIEHIIIDGSSSDNTLGVIEGYKTDSTIVISEPDEGMYDAINKGLQRASGTIIGLLHSDDELFDENTLQAIADAFEQNEPGLFFANGLFVEGDNTHKVVRNWVSKAYKSWKLYFGWVPLHTTMYFSKEATDELGYYSKDYRIASDYEYSLRVLRNKNIKKYYLNQYVVRMKMGGASTSMANQYAKSREDFLIMRKYRLPALFTLAFKILRKIPQFLLK